MTTIPVIWMNLAPDSIARGFWDQGLLERLFAGDLHRLRYEYEHHEVVDASQWPNVDAAVVVIPGSYHQHRGEEVNELLARLSWVFLIVTSDEESLFPIREIRHPRLRLWVEPHPAHPYEPSTRFLGVTCKADTLELLRTAPHEKSSDVFFAGQITHERRRRMITALEDLATDPDIDVDVLSTEGFTQGFDRTEYFARMAASKLVPAPSGPAIVDTFRFYEALEAQCVPLADSRVEGEPEGYWHILFGNDPPFPIVGDWSELGTITRRLLASWPVESNRIQAWWQRYKRGLVLRLEDDLDELRNDAPELTLADLVTVIVPTSPIVSHPSTAVIDETLDSIAVRLPGCEIVIVADGVRDEQEKLRGPYEAYLRDLLRSCAYNRRDVVPIVRDEWGHQANATRAALREVRTPLVLFVEHDCPLIGDIPFDDLARVIRAGEANVIRLAHEAQILEPHRHLMLDDEPRDVLGVPLTATVQWSQRPHLASTTFYRQMISRYFGERSRTMIEDVLHGVVQQAHDAGGWGMFRLFIFTPEGDIKRSTTSDGRGPEPKFDMVIEYDGGATPEWAPRATSTRVENRQPGEEDPLPKVWLDDDGAPYDWSFICGICGLVYVADGSGHEPTSEHLDHVMRGHFKENHPEFDL